jgi:heptose I phosphotransferase
MIYIKPEYKNLFAEFKSINDFLKIDINVVRDFKNRKTGRFEIEGQGFYIKKHFGCGLSAVIDELLHIRKPHIGASHERSALDKLESLGIDTMSVVAFGQEGKSLQSQRSFLVTKELTNVQSLENICRDWSVNPPSLKFKRALIEQVASIAKKLHDNGINHRDFYICHFLLDIAGGAAEYENCKPKLFLIDLHRAQIRRKLPFRWRVKDIGGLYFSVLDIDITRNDIYYFIRVYTGESLRKTFTQDKRLWEAVQKRAIKTYRKEFGKSPVLTTGTNS